MFGFNSKKNKTVKPVRNARLRLENLEERACPAELVWIGGVSDKYDVAGNWKLYTSATDTVGAVSPAAPTTADRVYFNRHGTRDCVMESTKTYDAESIKATAAFIKQLKIDGNFRLKGDTNDSTISDHVILRQSGNVIINQKTLEITSGIKIQGDAMDNDSGKIYSGYEGKIKITTALNEDKDMYASLIVGDVPAALDLSIGGKVKNKGSLDIVMAGNSKLSFWACGDIDTRPEGTTLIEYGNDAALVGHVGPNESYFLSVGTVTFKGGNDPMDLDMVTRFTGGVCNVEENSAVNFDRTDPLGAYSFDAAGSSPGGMTFNFGRSTKFAFRDGASTGKFFNSNINLLKSGVNTANVTFDGTGNLNCCVVDFAGADNYGAFHSTTKWEFTGVQFKMDVSSSNTSCSKITCDSLIRTVEFIGNSNGLVITVNGNGTSTVANATWDLFGGPANGKVDGYANVLIDSITAPPGGLSWSLVGGDADADTFIDRLRLKLS